MKTILLMLLTGSAYAQSNVQSIHTVYLSTETRTQTVSITSGPAVNVSAAVSSGSLSGYSAIEVYSVSGSTTLLCGFDVATTSGTSSAFYGREIAAGTALTFYVGNQRPVYCATANNTNSTKATITQFK